MKRDFSLFSCPNLLYLNCRNAESRAEEMDTAENGLQREKVVDAEAGDVGLERSDEPETEAPNDEDEVDV
jgi:hypothetical protein